MKKNILQLLEKSATKYPDKVAFCDTTRGLSYKDFVSESKSIGTALTSLGSRNNPIAIFIDRKVSCLTSMMGVVYSGNFYTIIDVTMPYDRVKVIFDTLNPIAMIVDGKSAKKAAGFGFDVEMFNHDEIISTTVDNQKLRSIFEKTIDTDPVYALFTSGSTGVPKGTVIAHRSVIDYSHWVCETFNITQETIFGSQTPFYFSMSVLDIFSTINSGATFYIIPKMYFSFPIKLLEFINEKKINTIYWVPSALCIVANFKVLDEVELPTLKTILFAGEVMPVKQLNVWIDHMDNDVLFANLYGPTEITDICTYYIVNRRFADDESLPIGHACDNCDVLIIKDDNTEAAQGEEGELCVRGSFLALGYYNNPEKTKGAFTQNPLNTCYPEIIYHTGDIVKYNELGEIIYMSRKDFQIKHMGYRIELGEIETAVNSIDGIIACACIYDMEASEIVLFYESLELNDNDIMNGVKSKVSKYMYPNKINKLDKMPHNANGKIDRVELKKIHNNNKNN